MPSLVGSEMCIRDRYVPPEPKGSFSRPPARHQFTQCETMDMELMHHTVCLFTPGYARAFAGTHYASPWRNGQAELTVIRNKVI